jgi:hypothetical protein
VGNVANGIGKGIDKMYGGIANEVGNLYTDMTGANTAYQRQSKDMQAAGLNPALMYGGTGASGAQTAQAAANIPSQILKSPTPKQVAQTAKNLKPEEIANARKVAQTAKTLETFIEA